VFILKVLFTGGGGAGTEALWKLYESRYEIHFADADLDTINPIVLPEYRHQIPWASESNFFEKINFICKNLDIDVLVPSVDEELVILARYSDQLLPTKLMLPDLKYVESMLDKLLMARYLEKECIPVPLTFPLNEDFLDISYPCIVKPRKGRGSRGVKVFNTRDEVLSFKKTMGLSAKDFIVQNKINGQEYTVQMAANENGQLSAVVPVKVGIKQGITISAEVENEVNVIEACRLIHQSCPTKGCYNVQLILTDNNVVMPFEINPRISTTYCLVVAANVDPIEIFLGKNYLDELVLFTPGVKLRRRWHNYFSN